MMTNIILFSLVFSSSSSRLEKIERKKGINILYVTSEIIFGIYFTSYTNNIIASSEEGALKTKHEYKPPIHTHDDQINNTSRQQSFGDLQLK